MISQIDERGKARDYGAVTKFSFQNKKVRGLMQTLYLHLPNLKKHSKKSVKVFGASFMISQIDERGKA